MFFFNRQIPLPANQRFFVSSQKIGTVYIYTAKGSEWKSAPKKERGTLQPMDQGMKQAMRITEFSMSMASSVIETASEASGAIDAELCPSM